MVSPASSCLDLTTADQPSCQPPAVALLAESRWPLVAEADDRGRRCRGHGQVERAVVMVRSGRMSALHRLHDPDPGHQQDTRKSPQSRGARVRVHSRRSSNRARQHHIPTAPPPLSQSAPEVLLDRGLETVHALPNWEGCVMGAPRQLVACLIAVQRYAQLWSTHRRPLRLPPRQ